jgi:hypothetical protein
MSGARMFGTTRLIVMLRLLSLSRASESPTERA